jgi:acyl-ACP thioesterase
MQEFAGNHAYHRNLGYNNIIQRGQVWVMSRMKIELQDYPRLHETMTIQTWVSAMVPTSNRHGELFGQDGRYLGSFSSIWALIDINTRRPVRLTDFDVLNRPDVSATCGLPSRIPDQPEYHEVASFFAAPNDLDMTGHVNNARYVEWMLNDYCRHLPNHEPSSLEVNYLGEIFSDEQVTLHRHATGSDYYYEVRRGADGKTVCRGKLYG